MTARNTNWFIFILALAIVSLWVDLSKTIKVPSPTNASSYLINKDVSLRLGLDLRGGLQTLLEADVPAEQTVDPQELDVTRQILENRVNGAGVSEIVMQTAGNNRIVAEFPGVSNADEVIKLLQQTGLLEFVDMGSSPASPGTIIVTDNIAGSETTSPTAAPSETAVADATVTVEPAATPSGAETPPVTPEAPATVYHTVFTGVGLKTVGVQQDTFRNYQIAFTLDADTAKVFADFTSSHVNQYLAIVLDKRVVSTPVIQSAITDGSGVISGTFTYDEANNLALQLRYGSLPVPVKVVESRTVGPSLGEESIRKSLLAGSIGLAVVILFMLFYYRLPGLLAALALVVYALLSVAIFKLGISFMALVALGICLILAVSSSIWWAVVAVVVYIGLLAINALSPVTLTLPGIAGFILSIGMAVDANILIFERMKEELRGGKSLSQAIDLGWTRAWPSIRDSNISTLITCLILFGFGSSFGASMVKGFSITLALGVVVSLFTAINVTRTFLHLVLDNTKLSEHSSWFGL